MSRQRASIAFSLVLAAGLTLTGCAREIDVATVGAEPVKPGAGTLHVFCDRFGTLVYFTKIEGEDTYEAFFAQACVPNSVPIVSTLQIAPAAQHVPTPDYWRPDGDLGNTQPGTEDEAGG